MAEGKPVKDSVSEYAELALPNDVNKLGNIFGGKVMHLVDLAGAMAAIRHARLPVVTASVDSLQFLHPVHSGELVLLRSSVNRAFRTSMEVGVKVWTENYIEDARRHVASAHLTFVAVDRQGNKLPVVPVIPETPEEVRRYENAGRRRDLRFAESERRRKISSAL